MNKEYGFCVSHENLSSPLWKKQGLPSWVLCDTFLQAVNPVVTPPTCRARSPYLYPPGGPVIPAGTWPDFCFLSDSCGFLDVGYPLWLKDESIIYLYSCFWALPEQWLFSRSPTEPTTIFYCLIWDFA
jgi:hypothetical protein